MQDLTGKQIKGYQVLNTLGAGAFGVVYQARQDLVNRDVAIKVIRGHLANQPQFIRRFEAEAQIIAQLEHLHIVPLYDFWREPDAAYLVMRLMPGGSLAEKIAQQHLGLAETGKILSQITAALDPHSTSPTAAVSFTGISNPEISCSMNWGIPTSPISESQRRAILITT
jgi:serine/threonine protein kinase